MTVGREDVGKFAINSYSYTIGHTAREFLDRLADRGHRSFELMIYPAGAYIDDPDQLLYQYLSGSTNNRGRFSNPVIDDLFARQTRTVDPVERRRRSSRTRITCPSSGGRGESCTGRR